VYASGAFTEQNSMEGLMVQEFVNHSRTVGKKTKSINGYRIEFLDADPRDIAEDRFAAYLVNRNECQYAMAFLPQFSASYYDDDHAEENTYLSEDFARASEKNSMIENEDRRNKTILIEFPEVVTNRIMSPDSDNGKIKLLVRNFYSKPFRVGRDRATGDPVFETNRKFNVIWYISIVEAEDRVLGTLPAAERDGQSALLESFEGTS